MDPLDKIFWHPLFMVRRESSKKRASPNVRDAVVSSSTVNQFKKNLDKHRSKQEMMYDYKAELARILSRSNT